VALLGVQLIVALPLWATLVGDTEIVTVGAKQSARETLLIFGTALLKRVHSFAVFVGIKYEKTELFITLLQTPCSLTTVVVFGLDW